PGHVVGISGLHIVLEPRRRGGITEQSGQRLTIGRLLDLIAEAWESARAEAGRGDQRGERQADSGSLHVGLLHNRPTDGPPRGKLPYGSPTTLPARVRARFCGALGRLKNRVLPPPLVDTAQAFPPPGSNNT